MLMNALTVPQWRGSGQAYGGLSLKPLGSPALCDGDPVYPEVSEIGVLQALERGHPAQI